MRASWKLARVAGIGIYVHVTFPILLAWVGLSHYLLRHSWLDVADGSSSSLRCSQSWSYRSWDTRSSPSVWHPDARHHPTAHVARLERIPDEPHQELLVALAGPAVNVVLAAVLFAALAASS